VATARRFAERAKEVVARDADEYPDVLLRTGQDHVGWY
jgi:hypothetical protein